MGKLDWKYAILLFAIAGYVSCNGVQNHLSKQESYSIEQPKVILKLKRSEIVGSFDSSGTLHVGVGGEDYPASYSDKANYYSGTPWEYFSIKDDKTDREIIPESKSIEKFVVVPFKNPYFIGYTHTEKYLSAFSRINGKWMPVSSVPLLTESLGQISFVVDRDSVLHLFADYIGNDSLSYSALKPNNLWSDVTVFDCIRLGLSGGFRFWKPLIDQNVINLLYLDKNQEIFLLNEISCKKRCKILNKYQNGNLINISTYYDDKHKFSWLAFFKYKDEKYILSINTLSKEGSLLNIKDMPITGTLLGPLLIEITGNNKVYLFWSAMTDSIHNSDVYVTCYDGKLWMNIKNISKTSNHSYLVDTFVKSDSVKVVWHEKSTHHWGINSVNELRFTTVR